MVKPFDLKEALAGAPVVHRNGTKILELHYFEHAKDDQKLYCLSDYEGNPISSYTDQGNYFHSGRKSEFDLFLAIETKKLWVNVFKEKDGYYASRRTHESYREALDYINDQEIENWVKTVCIEVEV